MKLLSEAYDIINKLEEGVGEVPPGIPSVGNVSYYSSVDEGEDIPGEWGSWHYKKEDNSWSIEQSEIDQDRDPWGRKLSMAFFTPFKNAEDELIMWKGNFKSPEGKNTLLIIWKN